MTVRPMRILFYSVVDRLQAGGAQMVIARLLASLRERGHAVTEAWAGPGPKGVAGGWIWPLYVRPAEPHRSRSRQHHMPSLARVTLGLLRCRPQIVNVHFVSAQTLYFLNLRRVFGYKVVLSVHGSDLLKPLPQERAQLAGFFSRADAITVVSENLKARILAHPGVDPAKIHVIPNGIDLRFWRPAGMPTEAGSPAPTIVAVGRLEHVKGFDILLQAMARLRRTIPAARLCIIGDGILAADLAGQIRDLGLAGAVELPGALGRDCVRRRLRDAAVLAMPSRSEGMPLALLEALACGVPVVATGVGGVPEVLTDGTGLLVPPEVPEAMADALARVLQDPDLAERLGQAGRQRAQDFSSDGSDAAYERLFRSLLGTA